jgi:hypothetical protein
MRALLEVWQPGESVGDLLERISERDVLGKQTAQRTQDMVDRVFGPRLLQPDDRAARWLKYFLAADGHPQTFREILFVYQARADDLLYDFTVERFWTACHEGALVLTAADALAFFDQASHLGLLPEPWSQQVQVKVARGLLAALRSYGFLREDTRGRKEIVPYRLSDAGLAYLAHELHFRAVPDGDLVEHPDWALFGLDRTTVLERLDALGAEAGLLVQRAGSVVRISWSHPSMEALIDATTR